VELLRNAVAALPLCEGIGEIQNRFRETNVLSDFIRALFQTNAVDEVEPTLSRKI
jgi:hypothetical protein